MSGVNLAVLGATGVVGNEILKILAESSIPINSLKLLSSPKSAGKKITFKGKEYTVQNTTNEVFTDVDIVLASAGASTSRTYVDAIKKAGAVIVDNSSAFRMDKDVPLVIAGVNDEDLRMHSGVVANPNCSTSQLMLALKPLHDYAGIKRLIVSTYQAVSGAGKAAMDELKAHTQAKLNNEPFETKAFVKPIAFNLIPQIDVFCDNAYTKEEMKVVNETKKILHLKEDTPISCTAVRVPVFIGHSEAVTCEFEKPLSAEKAREILSNSYGVIVKDDISNSVYPTPIEAAGTDPVYVGRIRKDLAFDNAISYWVVADNLRIGAALNTVRIAEKLVSMKLVRNS